MYRYYRRRGGAGGGSAGFSFRDDFLITRRFIYNFSFLRFLWFSFNNNHVVIVTLNRGRGGRDSLFRGLGGGGGMPQFAGPQLPPGLTQADVDAALNGPGWEKIRGTPEHSALQAYPNFNGMINPAAFEAFLANAPRSRNIEDRR